MVNLAEDYQGGGFTKPGIILFHENDSITVVKLLMDMNDFSYEEINEEESFLSKAMVKGSLYYNYTDRDLLDSMSIVIVDSSSFVPEQRDIDTVTFSFHANRGKDYVARFDISDKYSGRVYIFFLEIPKRDKNTYADYRVFDDLGDFLLGNIVDENTPICIQVPVGLELIYGRYYSRNFPVALPPFVEKEPSTFNYSADSMFIVHTRDGKSLPLFLKKPGFYHFRTDTNSRSGLTLFNFYQGFPDIITVVQLMEPIRYITTNKEYEDIRNSANIKASIDQFWLNNAGNPVRARNMISRFYGRVRDANQWFSSYIEGWKTDRGAIFIVFGPPNIVYRSNGFEEWIYGEAGNNNSLKFQFVKMENPFSNNDYALVKSLTYKEKWFDAVSAWRR
ncbi:MAG: GWxTD domain-containing protein [Bacteroidetes bacterium]|nr:GWxTD domain-containing protein [Bacteroidota bacterium]